MSREVFPYNEDNFDPSKDGVEAIENYLKKEAMAPAMGAVISLLRKAVHSDEALVNIDEGRTLFRRIRSVGDDNYHFVHDRLLLTPKSRTPSSVATRELRFAVSSTDHTNIRPHYVFITDFDEAGELISESIMTETSFGWYDENVALDIKNDYLVDVKGLVHEEEFDPETYALLLKTFDLREQTNEISEAA